MVTGAACRRSGSFDASATARLTEEGLTTLALPGEEEFMDVRGTDAARRNPDLPPDLSGQERSPDDAGGLSLDAALGGGN